MLKAMKGRGPKSNGKALEDFELEQHDQIHCGEHI